MLACGCAEAPPAGSPPLPDAAVAPAPRDLALPPDLATPGLGPPYPIILVHGMAGFKNIGALEYFQGVPEALAADGRAVFVSRQDPINDSEVRGLELEQFVFQVLEQTRASHVHLIGHSQGGFDARWVASRNGDRVATVVTVASPMGGTPVADLAFSNGPGAEGAIDALLGLYGALNGFDSDAQAQLAELTSAGAADFFARHPDDPRVTYYSLAGRSALSLGGADCDAPNRPAWVAKYDANVDPVDPLLSFPSGILDGAGLVHDGLVPVPSARHGTFLGCVPADHLDEIGQLAGDSPGIGNPFDSVQLYRDLATLLP